MHILKNEIIQLISKNELVIRPLLDVNQVGELTLDIRLGYDFLVSILGRDAFIDTSYSETQPALPVSSFFKDTRRRFGETFLLYPNQSVITTSIEYIKLPPNVFAILNMRSSYARLGITISTILQPGYCGCVPIELTNTNVNPVKLVVGARIIQVRFVKLSEETNYFNQVRKYLCHVRPEVSAINQDSDLKTLYRIKKNL